MEPLSLFLEWHFLLLPGLAPPESSLLLPGLAGDDLSHLPGREVQSEAGHQLSLRVTGQLYWQGPYNRHILTYDTDRHCQNYILYWIIIVTELPCCLSICQCCSHCSWSQLLVGAGTSQSHGFPLPHRPPPLLMRKRERRFQPHLSVVVSPSLEDE